MAWIKATALKKLQNAGRLTLTLDEHKILFIWHEDQIHAVQAQCPHLKLPLKKATITKKCEIVCPFHKSTFDLDTGSVVSWSSSPPLIGPLLAKFSCPKPLRIYPTRVENNHILVSTD
jgi:nitrite reductase/ring-hydroxylating ferredoxin subunit